MSGVNHFDLSDVRSTFLAYFARNGHEIVPSSPLVPRNDPTLMFANSGMVQFKNLFTGIEKRPYSRASTAQKSVRAGGKHNDLDNVGYTARHHTFFEMLGNFSFGDYFKDQAIYYAWTLITKEFGLPADKLTVTVYHTDDEAFGLWKKIAGLPDERIVRIPTSDNFWQMGDTGPCGPCSEIFYDHGPEVWGGPPGSPDADGDRFIEIWNLVFMQYEQFADGTRVPLPKPSIDTGMGLERVAAVLQGVHDNYDIDLFKALIATSVDLIGVPAVGESRASHRVIADHLRSMCFLIADGVLPSNEGRGYVLRRIMRRAMRHAHLLGARDPVIYKMIPALIAQMGRAYPELQRAELLISETVRLEETRFRNTLERGLSLLDEASGALAPGDVLDGETAFKLYDTYGFPLDLTQDALRTRSIGVDTDAFQAAMQRQKKEARASWAGSGEAASETIWYEIREEVGATEFLGYDTEDAEAVVTALVADGAKVATLAAGAKGSVVVNQTPFYGESGGQVGDAGEISFAGGAFRVDDTQKLGGGLFVHSGEVVQGNLPIGTPVRLRVDHRRRSAIRANHSATHLLHEALRSVLGEHVAQKGSLVTPERLRFDISHPKPISEAELARVEDISNRVVLADEPVTTRLMAVDDAVASGARALFGEKYGDEVRVVSMGSWPAGEHADATFSIELCGGTHVSRTGEIGLITVLSDSGVAAGVRRIEALTGEEARHYLNGQDHRVRELAALLRCPPAEVSQRIETLIEERRRFERELNDAKKKLAMGGGATSDGVVPVGSFKLLARLVNGIAPKDLKALVDEGKKQVGSGIVVFVGVSDDGKAGIVAGVTEDLTGRFNAVDLVKVGSEVLGGKGGGGRPDLAQAGGPDGSKAEAALAAVTSTITAAA
ncbi:MAG: alanine--tRNA ligase [Ancalomicrobiaceae bacterium]|nr:alanine--tRNA ligase [Ancalomicrobiaceae bacterium]